LDEKTQEIVAELRAISPETYGMTDRAASLIESLSERVGELERGLKPFADLAAEIESAAAEMDEPISAFAWSSPADNCIAARALLSKQEERK